MFGKYVLAATGLVGLVAVGPVANASVISTGPLSNISGVATTKTDWTGNIVLPKFNSSLGLLQSVSLSISDAFSTTLTIQNALNASAASGQASTVVTVGIADPGGLFASDNTGVNLVLGGGGGFASSSLFNSSSQARGYGPLAGGQTVTPTAATGAGNGVASFTQSNILAEFTGAGNINIAASTFTQTSNQGVGGNLTITQITTASATGTVTYTYIPAAQLPEPFSAALLGSAVVGLGFLRRRFS